MQPAGSWVSVCFVWLQGGQFQLILASPRTVQTGKTAPAEGHGAGTQLFPTFQMNPLAMRVLAGLLLAFPRGIQVSSFSYLLWAFSQKALQRAFSIC